MSQWNNSYTYNNQYQGSSNWNADPSGLYANQQNYYNNGTYDTPNQYVSFNEFISQMQSNGGPSSSSANFNNVQYQNYPANQYNYQEAPTTSQTATYNYRQNTPSVPNGVPSYTNELQPSVQPVASTSYTSELVSKSNLTPTATEFVPKNTTSSTKQSSSKKNTPSLNSKSDYSYREKNNTNSSSSDKNWRERPQNNERNQPETAQDNESRRHQDREFDNSKNSNSIKNRNPNRDYSSSNHEIRNQNQNHNSNQEHRNRNNEYNGSQDNRNRYQDSSRSETYYQNDRIEKNQNKYNNKQKNKYTEQTFYNSKIQDSRNRGEGSGRNKGNWSGSQRLRTDQGNVEDEQFATNYMQFKDEKVEKLSREVKKSPARSKSKYNEVAGKEMTQRERLSDQLDRGTLECLVCCECVKQTDSVWFCGNCYHVLHLRCIRKWSVCSMVEGKWRCPACQNINSSIPTDYFCMCGTVRNPEYQRGSSGAHTCGKACKRPRTCPHPCTLLCHPGPCPPCQATVNKQCGCGAETRSILCSSKLPQVCGRICHKTLECGVHTCTRDCHDDGPCGECTEMVTQVCYCPAAKSRTVPCSASSSRILVYSCGGACGRVAGCGAHVCRAVCHEPPCEPCGLLPERTTTCPCGRTRLKEGARTKCTDPIPLCENICAKPLPCGPDGDKHFCKLNCHHGACPVCSDTTLVQCRCGHSSKEIPCKDLPEMAGNVLCQRKCNKKLSCGRHRCRAVCCNCSTHRCEIVCGRMLSCQLHRCERTCHTARCDPCPQLSFEELRCACGAQVLYPPVACGARAPACAASCVVPRDCGHPPHHTCHAGDCPPCVVLTTKTCHGKHEERKTIPCSQEEFSCGLPCGKPLPCGKHNCIKICHKGPCDTDICKQPCREKRAWCGHPCAAPCHVGTGTAGTGTAGTGTGTAGTGTACPSSSPCRAQVRVTCLCRRRSATRTCHENAAHLDKLVTALAATKMQDGGSVDLSDVQKPEAMLRTLECDDECRVEARTRQLALALQIRNPDVSSKLAPRYNDSLRNAAARDPAFATMVHDKLTDLVHLAKKSKQKTRSHSFPSMNWQKRQFIHELCEHFGCESVAYDAEPNRNVVATADKEKSWLPAMSVLEVVSREAGKRKVPGPVLRSNNNNAPAAHTTNNNKSASGWATLTSTNAWAARAAPRPTAGSSTASSTSTPTTNTFVAPPERNPAQDKIDYFDNPPEN